MKLAILTTLLLVALAAGLPVEEQEPPSVGPQQVEADGEQPPEDLKADSTFWGLGGYYRHYGGYGGWGGYHNPYYSRNYYHSWGYPTYYRSFHYW